MWCPLLAHLSCQYHIVFANAVYKALNEIWPCMQRTSCFEWYNSELVSHCGICDQSGFWKTQMKDIDVTWLWRQKAAVPLGFLQTPVHMQLHNYYVLYIIIFKYILLIYYSRITLMVLLGWQLKIYMYN